VAGTATGPGEGAPPIETVWGKFPRSRPAWGWIASDVGLNQPLFDVEIDSEQDERPEHDAEH